MTEAAREAVMRVDGDSVVVLGDRLQNDRVARMFFASILGGQRIERGWLCPRRRQPLETLVVRINTFLEARGWSVDREGYVDAAVQRETERSRSFKLTREKAAMLREGHPTLKLADVSQALQDGGWNSATRKLREHQLSGLMHGLTAVNAANFSVPGSGKTATSLAVAVTHLEARTIDLVVVVGPLACFAPWEREVRIALMRPLTTKRVRGTAAQRRVIYQAARSRDLLLLSYASAAADRVALIALCKRHSVMMIVDESHRMKRFRGGLWAPALMDIAEYAKVKLVLSGTPMPQDGRDLYSQLNVLWPKGRLTGPRETFAARVANDFPGVLEDIRPFVSRIPKAALGLPPYEVVRHEVTLVGTQAEVYDLIESRFRRRLADTASWADKLASLRRGRPIRLLQAASNPDTLNHRDSQFRLPRLDDQSPSLLERLAAYRGTEVPAKSKAALSLLRELSAAGEKTVCWSTFVPNLDQFAQLVQNELGIPCFQIDGRVPSADDPVYDSETRGLVPNAESDSRERIIERFLDMSGAAALITNPASCSESISLHRSCRNAIYLDRTYDCAQFLQSIDRIHRLGLPADAHVTIHILLATLDGRPTIDGLVDASIGRKEAVMKQLLEGAELRPVHLSDDPLENAQGDDEDLALLLRFLLGQDV